jgi:hypothetical protein
MRSLLVSTAFAVASCLSSCSSISVSDDYDESFDFGALKTWSWHPSVASSGGEQGIVTLTDARIRSAIEGELASRGYPQAANGASFLVAYHATVAQKVEAGAEPYGYGWRSAYMAPTVMTYEEGTLLVDFIDPRSKAMVWRGTASAVVDASDSAEKREERIREAVRKVLERFPPGKK